MTPDTTEARAARLLSLLSDWQDRRHAGEEPSPQQLAPDEPELWDDLARQIHAARQLDPDGPIDLVATDDGDGASTAADLPEAPPGYRLLRFLARGGMGAVYEATQEGLNRPVALKTLRAGERAQRAAVIRFLAEAEAVAAVSHRHVVQVYDFGEHAGRPYLALEFCPGGDLAARLANEPLGIRDAAELLEKIARGVQAAHDRGIVHRDLKPGNVLFGEDGEPKIADFGLAKRVASDITQSQAVMGTLAYMAPEQASGKSKFVGPQADVWALGAILYEALTGQRPFTGRTHDEVLAKVLAAEPEPPRRVKSAVPRDLEQICLACLAKNPNDRYPTAGALADDLRRFLDGMPVSVRPAGRVVRTAKWVRRNPVPTALILALVALVAVTVTGARLTRAEQERTFAEQQQRLLDSYKARMELALQRGDGLAAVNAFHEAVAAGVAVTPEMRLNKARGHAIASDSAAARQEVAALDRDALPPEARSLADLLEGDLLVGSDDERANQLLDRAIADPHLPEADRHYARGLRATRSEDALRLFQRAYELDAAHIEARGMAGLTLFGLGRLDDVIRLSEESRPFAPNHPYFRLLPSLAFAFKGDKARATALVDSLRPAFPDDPRFASASDSLKTVFQLAAILLASQRDSRPPTFADMFEISRLMVKLMTAQRDLQAFHSGSGQMLVFRIPIFLRNGMNLLLNEVLTIGDRLDGGTGTGVSAEMLAAVRAVFPHFRAQPSAFLLTDDASVAAARDRLASHPEGFLKTAFATALWGRAMHAWNTNRDVAASRAMLAQTAATFEDALDTPGLIGHERICFQFGLMAHALSSTPRGEAPLDVAAARRGAELARRWIRSPHGPRDWFEFPIATRVALYAGDHLLANELLAAWSKFPPGQDYWVVRAQLDFRAGAYHATLEALDKAFPTGHYVPGAHDVVAEIRDEARHKLGLPEWVPPPRRVYEPAPAPRPTGR